MVVTERGYCVGNSWRGYANAYALWRFGDRLDDKVRLGATKQASHFINALPI
ncbi:hypothetical protein [Nostoc sp.]|uniref:hypothetical protein n=1 Tax=Nostoc sp. TaxID=1180 RepID=UPI002FF97010